MKSTLGVWRHLWMFPNFFFGISEEMQLWILSQMFKHVLKMKKRRTASSPSWTENLFLTEGIILLSLQTPREEWFPTFYVSSPAAMFPWHFGSHQITSISCNLPANAIQIYGCMRSRGLIHRAHLHVLMQVLEQNFLHNTHILGVDKKTGIA